MNVFCKECGSKLKDSSSFCKECGASRSEESAQKGKIETVNSVSTPMSKKTKRLLIIGCAAAVILFGGYKAGEAITSKDRLIDRFETALVESDEETVAKLLTSHDKKLDINKDTVKGFMKYMKENPEYIPAVVKDLRQQSKLYDRSIDDMDEMYTENEMVSLERKGKSLFFYDKYVLNVPAIYTSVSTNYKDTVLYVDGKELGKASKGDFTKKYGPYLPGIYLFESKLKTDLIDLVKKEEVTLDNYMSEGGVDLSLNGEEITLNLGLSEEADDLKGTLFINGKDVGINPFKQNTFGPVLIDGSMTVSVETDLPWGKVKTKEVSIDEESIYLNLGDNEDYKNGLMKQVAVYENEFLSAYTSGDMSKMTTATEEFKDNWADVVDYDRSYGNFYKGKYLGSTYDLDSFAVYFEDGKWVAYADAEVSYLESEYSEGYAPELANQEHSKRYQLEYDVNRNVWLVNGVDEIYGLESENVKEVKQENPKEFTTVWASEPDVEVVSTETDSAAEANDVIVSALMDGYLNGLIAAINGNDFSAVEPYLLEGSQLYKDQEKLVSKLSEEGTTEELNSYTITDFKSNEEGVSINTEEEITIHMSDGSSETKTFNWQYNGEYDGIGDLKLTSIE
ncbi:zinc ribbon domain-containing protein [Metabacillus indicus]|uniref:zinc ribbon domain-containing protein n=1 Tax=Metabacillus indicus TaxID=246786 RepID=UPI003CF677C3